MSVGLAEDALPRPVASQDNVEVCAVEIGIGEVETASQPKGQNVLQNGSYRCAGRPEMDVRKLSLSSSVH